jgi:hypothetical protein
VRVSRPMSNSGFAGRCFDAAQYVEPSRIMQQALSPFPDLLIVIMFPAVGWRIPYDENGDFRHRHWRRMAWRSQ